MFSTISQNRVATTGTLFRKSFQGLLIRFPDRGAKREALSSWVSLARSTREALGVRPRGRLVSEIEHSDLGEKQAWR